MSKRITEMRLHYLIKYVSPWTRCKGWSCILKRIIVFLSVIYFCVSTSFCAGEGRQNPLLNLTHSVILKNWSSEKSSHTDSGSNWRNITRQNISVVGLSLLKHVHYLWELKKEFKRTMLFNCMQLSHICTFSFRTKKSDPMKNWGIADFFPSNNTLSLGIM